VTASASVWRDQAGDAAAPVVAVIHGSMDRSAGMLRVSRRLDEHFLVLRYDRRGYARSVDVPGPFGMAEQVADLVDVLSGRRAVLVGHSYGGNVALALAARRPELVAAVAIFEIPLSWEPWWPGTTAGSRAIATAGEPEEAAERFLRRLIGDERWEGLPEGTREARRREGPAMVGELTDLRDRPPWSAAEIAVPVVAAFGSRGAAHHRHGMQVVADSIAGAVLVELEDCRHDAPLSHPGLFCDLVVRPSLVAAGPPWSTA